MASTILRDIQAYGVYNQETRRGKKGHRVIYLGSKTVKASGVSGSDGELWKLASI